MPHELDQDRDHGSREQTVKPLKNYIRLNDKVSYPKWNKLRPHHKD